MVAGSPCATSNQALLKTALIFLLGRSGESGQEVIMAQIKNTSVSHAFSIYLFIYSNIFIQGKNIISLWLFCICALFYDKYLHKK